MAAAALCVGVGSFSDPKEIQGLAHFVEHMVFMGSKKFPQENDFDAFIKKHGGSDNGSTDCETTTFYFECFEKHLFKALDKFAQFFIAPLMKRESMTREREAVESEFQMALPSDEFRKDQLLASFATVDSPINSFSWGNLITLKANVDEDKLYDALHEFRQRHYSAHRMTVAVQGKISLDVLQDNVISCFSSVPNNELPSFDFKKFRHCFETDKFNKFYFVKPMKDICNLEVTWALPSLLDQYRCKPHHYISWLLGHEGKGSLLSYLRKKVLALSVYAGNGESGCEHNSMFTLFTITVVLTKQGCEKAHQVIEAIFSYISLLKREGPQKWIFKEIQRIESTSFQFSEEESAVDNVEEISECMQFYPPKDYLTGSDLYFEYNPEAIMMILNQMSPNKMNIMLFSHNLPSDKTFDKKEKWFGTEYTDKEISSEMIKKLEDIKPYPEFHLPEKNKFLTENFSLLPKAENHPKYPQKIIQNSVLELWYRRDQKFGLPLAYYYFYLITPLAMDNAQNSCLLDMYVDFLVIELAEECYPATLAELSYSFEPFEKGIIMKVTGYDEKLPVLIDIIGNYIRNLPNTITEEMFVAVKDKEMKKYYNQFIKPSKLAKDLRLSILQNKYFSLLEKHDAVVNITTDMVTDFARKLFKKMYIQCLVQGNVSENVVTDVVMNFIKTVECGPLDSNTELAVEVAQIPLGEHCCRVLSFNKNDANSIITNYYQLGLLTIKNCVTMEFIMHMIEEPLFDILRTKEQLGYNVYCTVRDTCGILGYSITVNAQVNKYSTEHVDQRIEHFIKHVHKLLKTLSNKKMFEIKKDLIKIKNCVDIDLEDEVERNWAEIVTSEYIFDRVQKEINEIQNLKVSEIRKFWDNINQYGNHVNYRKISMQIVGQTNVENSDENTFEEGIVQVDAKNASQKYSLRYLGTLEDCRKEKKNESYFIKNIPSFKKKLHLYPTRSKAKLLNKI
ncbi:nardilysin [Agrilus planipennis]|uniref:Nardilysin n=1 Tax=Agrilus planipennis TaxID=224129 RepID=A0A1W4XQR2_AGRPL|nr:nardilysin [Agrilus planipennis]